MNANNHTSLTVTDDIAADALVNTETLRLPKEPFRNIALMFSGGGFRAASFSLGALSYLYRIKYKDQSLLQNVQFTTSTSGGSITNAFYATRLYTDKNFSFPTFYQELRNKLDGETMLQCAFDILKDDTRWTEQGTLTDDEGHKTKIFKKRNLINAFAKTYDELLFSKTTLSDLLNNSKNVPDRKAPHLHEICFNSTEFNNGLNFYFQVNGYSNKVMPRGNGYLKFDDFVAAKKIKLSDIVAASSCFPSGFEPILFPNDFVHEGCADVNEMLNAIEYNHNNPLKLCTVANQPFALMDGGIADNMGIHSVMINDDERSLEDKFDLILSCDVTSYFNNPLKTSTSKRKGISAKITLQAVINCFKFAILICLASIIGIATKRALTLSYLLLIPSLTLSVIYFLFYWKLRKLKKKSDGTVKVALKYINYFLRLPFGSLLPMLQERAKSSLMLVADLFLKQIRRSQYDHLFTSPLIKDRVISCLIYEFSSAHQQRRLKNLDERDSKWWNSMSEVLMPGKEIQNMVNDARLMGTTLWFGEYDNGLKDQIIATGQLTTCYSLIKHICRLEVLNPEYKTNKPLQDLKKLLLMDWETFKTNPQFMIDSLSN